MIEDGKKFSITLSEEEGLCGSGWAKAPYGYMEIEELDSFPGMQFRAKNPLEEYNFPNSVFYTYKVFSFSEYGSDKYYPSGYYNIDMKQFVSNGRDIKTIEDVKRKVWIFSGDSKLGKTFLSDKTGLSKYETDSSSELRNLKSVQSYSLD